MIAATVVFLLCLLPLANFASYNLHEDIYLDTIGLLKKYRYPAEVHRVVTEDGYILALHRVPYSPRSPLEDGKRKPVVFVQHGILSSSADWVVMGPGAGLAYILADDGYDVWLGNFRGNTYSRAHIKYNPDAHFDHKFWLFEFHEMGIYDLPASIDYVLEQTGEEKLYYIGHSMGTTTFFVMTSMKPEYNDKIRAMFAFAPVTYMGHMADPAFQVMSLASKPIEFLVGNEVLPNSKLLKLVGYVLCNDKAPTQFLCKNIFFQLFGGYDNEELNSTMLPVIMGHTPAGGSARTFEHFFQLLRSFKFRQWDYYSGNKAHYGSKFPPDYNLTKVTAPVFLHYSDNDWINAVQDVEQLNMEISNPIGMFRVPYSKFNHLDYMWAIHAKEYLYDKVLNQMAQY